MTNKDNQNMINEGSSMEDILASIRRAMQDKPTEESASSSNLETDNQDVLDLTPGPSPERHYREDPAPTTDLHYEREPSPSQHAEKHTGSSFLDRDVELKTQELLSHLDHEVQRKQKQEFEESYLALERILRPILREWCNQHLPEIVARSVQREIKQLVHSLARKHHG